MAEPELLPATPEPPKQVAVSSAEPLGDLPHSLFGDADPLSDLLERHAKIAEAGFHHPYFGSCELTTLATLRKAFGQTAGQLRSLRRLAHLAVGLWPEIRFSYSEASAAVSEIPNGLHRTTPLIRWSVVGRIKRPVVILVVGLIGELLCATLSGALRGRHRNPAPQGRPPLQRLRGRAARRTGELAARTGWTTRPQLFDDDRTFVLSSPCKNLDQCRPSSADIPRSSDLSSQIAAVGVSALSTPYVGALAGIERFARGPTKSSPSSAAFLFKKRTVNELRLLPANRRPSAAAIPLKGVLDAKKRLA